MHFVSHHLLQEIIQIIVFVVLEVFSRYKYIYILCHYLGRITKRKRLTVDLTAYGYPTLGDPFKKIEYWARGRLYVIPPAEGCDP